MGDATCANRPAILPHHQRDGTSVFSVLELTFVKFLIFNQICKKNKKFKRFKNEIV